MAEMQPGNMCLACDAQHGRSMQHRMVAAQLGKSGTLEQSGLQVHPSGALGGLLKHTANQPHLMRSLTISETGPCGLLAGN